jgi:hypothetical protein
MRYAELFAFVILVSILNGCLNSFSTHPGQENEGEFKNMENDSIPAEVFGSYYSSIGHGEYGDELHFTIGVNGDKKSIYREYYVGNHYFTYFKILSFDTKTGTIKAQSELKIVLEDEFLRTEEDSSEMIELTIIKRGDTMILKSEKHIENDFFKYNPVNKMIYSKTGLPIQLVE